MIIQQAYPSRVSLPLPQRAPEVAAAPAVGPSSQPVTSPPPGPSDAEILTLVVRDWVLPGAAVMFPKAAPMINLGIAGWNGLDAARKWNDPKVSRTEIVASLTKAAAAAVNAGLQGWAPDAELARTVGSFASITASAALTGHKLQNRR